MKRRYTPIDKENQPKAPNNKSNPIPKPINSKTEIKASKSPANKVT